VSPLHLLASAVRDRDAATFARPRVAAPTTIASMR
jgi:hypothetical protein